MPSWIRTAVGIVEQLAESQADAIEAAAQIAARSIADDGVVYTFGTGHSRMPVEEIFPRYGSYPGFQPLVELSMTFHTQVVGANGQRQAMFIERVEGLAGSTPSPSKWRWARRRRACRSSRPRRCRRPTPPNRAIRADPGSPTTPMS